MKLLRSARSRFSSRLSKVADRIDPPHKSLMSPAPGGDLTRYDGTPPPKPGLQVVRQDDPIKGGKYAQLRMDEHGEAYFIGTAGFKYPYYTEGRATCAMGEKHKAPDPDCTCGFWIPVRKESALSHWSADTVQIEVEVAGRVIEYGADPEPKPPWGYRAEWMRVLSVSLSPACGVVMFHGGPCVGDASSLVVWGGEPRGQSRNGQVLTACARHSMIKQAKVIDRPLSWLRRSLRTEVRPGLVQDDPAGGLNEWRTAIREVSAELCPLATLTQSPDGPFPADWLPGDPQAGDTVIVCADVRTRLQYALEYNGNRWAVEHIYHPKLAPWGWGEPGGV